MTDTSLDLQTVLVRYMPFLMEIRKRLLFVAAVFLVAATVGFIYFQPIITFVMKLYDLKDINIAFTSPFQFINLSVNSGIIIGTIIVFPLVLYQAVSFVKPALQSKEYRLILSLIPAGVILFIVGFAFGSWIMKFVVSIFSQQSRQMQIQNLWDIEHFLTQIFMTALFMGILFQFPIILTPLIRLRVVKYSAIANLRMLIYAVLVILTLMMPPTDLLSDALIFFPLAILFELTLLLNRGIN